MAGIGPAPNPESRVRQKNPNAGPTSWVELPREGRKDPAPALPKVPRWLGKANKGKWPAATTKAWREMWALPQATQWDQTGKSLLGWAQLHALVELEGPLPARLAEMRQHEDRHGLSPAAMQRLRWRIPPAPEPDELPGGIAGGAGNRDRRASVLSLIRGGEESS
jgi:hypothetical protein